MVNRIVTLRRRWVVLIAGVILVVLVVRLADVAFAISSYRVIDGRTLAVETISGPWTWTRVTSLTETASSVTVGVSSISAPLAGYGGDIVEVTVNLRDPIGSRTVIDASSGHAVPRK